MVTATPRSTTPIRQLPIQPRPRAGEGRTTFIERLATANFLRPSYLRAYLRDPDSKKAAPSWERLARITGATRSSYRRSSNGSSASSAASTCRSGTAPRSGGDAPRLAVRRATASGTQSR